VLSEIYPAHQESYDSTTTCHVPDQNQLRTPFGSPQKETAGPRYELTIYAVSICDLPYVERRHSSVTH